MTTRRRRAIEEGFIRITGYTQASMGICERTLEDLHSSLCQEDMYAASPLFHKAGNSLR